MKLRNALIAGIATITLAAAPLFAATLSGKVIDVNENSITVMKDGRATVYVLPSDLQIQSRSDKEISVSQLRGQTVTLTVSDSMQRPGEQGQQKAKPRVTNIRVDGDLEVDSETDVE